MPDGRADLALQKPLHIFPAFEGRSLLAIGLDLGGADLGNEVINDATNGDAAGRALVGAGRLHLFADALAIADLGL